MILKQKPSGYTITTNPRFQDEKYGYTDEIVAQLEELYLEAQDKKNKNTITKLTELVIKYPKSPQLKNFLSIAYVARGKYSKAIEVNNWILAEHSDYLFAKLNQAHDYLTSGELSKAELILGEEMEIKALYPNRDLFHISEFTAFYFATIRYYYFVGKLALAQNRLEILKSIAPDHVHTQEAEKLIRKLIKK